MVHSQSRVCSDRLCVCVCTSSDAGAGVQLCPPKTCLSVLQVSSSIHTPRLPVSWQDDITQVCFIGMTRTMQLYCQSNKSLSVFSIHFKIALLA